VVVRNSYVTSRQIVPKRSTQGQPVVDGRLRNSCLRASNPHSVRTGTLPDELQHKMATDGIGHLTTFASRPLRRGPDLPDGSRL
jgi:hypothetical protein